MSASPQKRTFHALLANASSFADVHARRKDGHDDLEGSDLFCCLYFLESDAQGFFVGSSDGFSYTVSVGPIPVSKTMTGSPAVIAKCGTLSGSV